MAEKARREPDDPDAPKGEETVDPTYADDPELAHEREHDPAGKMALYRRFRDDGLMYRNNDPPGAISADLVGCGWACRQCWSSYGLAGKENAKWYTAEDAADRVIGLARKRGRSIIRITNGEPWLYPQHVVELARHIVDSEGEPALYCQIETNGLRATPEIVELLATVADEAPADPRWADEHGIIDDVYLSRVWMRWSVKACDAEQWSWHTGRPEREYATVIENLKWALENAPTIDHRVSVVGDLVRSFEQQQEFAKMVTEIDPEANRGVDFERCRTYFPRARQIDVRMGERRLKMGKASPHWGRPGWNEEWLMGNNLRPPFPK